MRLNLTVSWIKTKCWNTRSNHILINLVFWLILCRREGGRGSAALSDSLFSCDSQDCKKSGWAKKEGFYGYKRQHIAWNTRTHFPVTDSFFKRSEHIKEMILKKAFFEIDEKTARRLILDSCREREVNCRRPIFYNGISMNF